MVKFLKHPTVCISKFLYIQFSAESVF